MGSEELSDSKKNVCWRNLRSHWGAGKVSLWVNCSPTLADSSASGSHSSCFGKLGFILKVICCQKSRKVMIVTEGTSKARKRKLLNNSKALRKRCDWGQRQGVHISFSKEQSSPSVPGAHSEGSEGLSKGLWNAKDLDSSTRRRQ